MSCAPTYTPKPPGGVKAVCLRGNHMKNALFKHRNNNIQQYIIIILCMMEIQNYFYNTVKGLPAIIDCSLKTISSCSIIVILIIIILVKKKKILIYA